MLFGMSVIDDIAEPTIAELQAQIAQQQLLLSENQKVIDAYEDQVAWLEERLKLLESKRYKHSSEKLNALQGRLFDESELDAEISSIRDKLDDATRTKETSDKRTTKAKKTQAPEDRPKRKPLPEHLRRVQIEVDLSAEQKQAMGDDWEQVGWETSEQLACQEREYFVKQIRRAKYVRKTADKNKLNTGGIKVAPVLPVMLPKAIADATVLAKIVTGKFVDALSFNRECKVLQREGVDISYSTLCSYPIQLNERLAPFKALFYEYVAEQPLWHLDETPFQVLQEPDREAREKSYLWALRAGPPGAQVALFHYDERRNYDALSSWLSEPLKQFNGVIVTDEHKPYARLASETKGIVARGGCWAHCRRKYVDAIKGRRDDSEAHKLVARIAKLYALETKVQSGTYDQRLVLRERLIRPWLDEFKSTVDALLPKYTKESYMRRALFYTQNNWESLTAFMKHADLPLDNNPVEQSIRPFAVGRRNWLYSGSPRGAHASAFMYSLVESAKANKLEPRAYLQALFERYPHATTTEERRQLLPMYFKNS